MRVHTFNLKPSRLYAVLWVGLIIASLGVTFILPLTFLSHLMLALGVTGYGGYILWQYGLLKGPSAILCISHQYEVWSVRTRDDQTLTVTLCGDSIVTAWVLILRFKRKTGRRVVNCIILRDALSTCDFRRLSQLLRHGRSTG